MVKSSVIRNLSLKYCLVSAQVIAFSGSQIFAFCENAQAQLLSGGFDPARAVQLRWISSASPSYTSTYITPGVRGWDGISSKVSYSQVSSGAYDVRVVTTTTAQNGLLGLTTPYCTSGGNGVSGSACISVKNWGSAQVAGYTNQIASLNLNTTQIISSVYCHEFGHVLSLAHSNPGVTAVMTASDTTTYLPQSTDKANLKAKWGN